MITALIPAHNEVERIGKVVEEALAFVDEAIVVDDGSCDGTASAAEKAGASVIVQQHLGYAASLKRGVQAAGGDIIVTLDADGEHNPRDIPQLLALIQCGEADLVLGRRELVPSVSERFIGKIVALGLPVKDHGTGLRAMKKDVAQILTLKGMCTCGTLVLEAASRGARIREVPIMVRNVAKKRRRKWIHMLQVVYVLYYLYFFLKSRAFLPQ